MNEKICKILFKILYIDCLGCGSLIVKDLGLCERCERQIDGYLLQAEDLLDQQLSFRSIYEWYPGQSDLLSSLVYLLKNNLSLTAWHALAAKFIETQGAFVGPETLFIPIPSSRGRRHSLYFAQSLSRLFGADVCPALTVQPATEGPEQQHKAEQKMKTLKQRQTVAFNFNEEFTEQIRNSQHLVLVDDVITSGASYKAAHSALKTYAAAQTRIELWTAFRRDSVLKSRC